MRAFARVALLAGGLAALAAIAAWAFIRELDQPGPLSQERIVLLEPGSGARAIATRLQAAGVVRNAVLFRLAARYLGRARALRPGEYAFSPAVTLRQVITKLADGDVVVRKLTIPEGWTSYQIVAALRANDALRGDPGDVPPEGSLFPTTYFYSYGDSRAGLLERMRRKMRAELEALYPARAKGLPLKSPEQAVIMASLIQMEAGNEAEMPVIASVFYNRLKKGMRLQSDPTVIYGLTKGRGALGRALRSRDLRQPMPHNTYVIAGLPPTPISNPGRAALLAALHPASTSYLYFVADGSGGHVFARSLKEHNRNVLKWRRLKKAG